MRADRESYYLVLLGGTGAKCGEIMLHMCANGYFQGKRLCILYVDSDSGNGNAAQLKRVLEIYQKCRKLYLIEESPIPCFFRTEVDFQYISPVGEYTYFRELAAASGLQDSVGINSAEIMMKAIYSEEECNMKISEGFFAHPNVGAAFFAANMNRIMDRLCMLVQSDQSEMMKIKIFVIGSIFGGTGASSFPTISKFLKKKLVGESDNDNIDNLVKIGGCMLLPYFSFSKENVRESILEGEEINIEEDKFVTKTKMALRYYKGIDGEQNKLTFDCLYMMGHDQYDARGYYHTAGAGQINMPHITEFYSAMSAVDFFEKPMDQRGRFFSVIPSDKIGWANIYKYPRGYYSFFVMMRFAIVMKSLILEELFDYTCDNKLKPNVDCISWFYDFLNGREESSDMSEEKLYENFDAISQYCDEYVRWFAELNISNPKKKKEPGTIEYDNANGESDVVDYLRLFDKKLLIKQYHNCRIVNGEVDGESEVNDKVYKSNLKYIRKYFKELEKWHSYTDARTEEIGMEKIWSRVCDLGCNHTKNYYELLQNMSAASDRSMAAGVRNLVNAIFIACMI